MPTQNTANCLSCFLSLISWAALGCVYEMLFFLFFFFFLCDKLLSILFQTWSVVIAIETVEYVVEWSLVAGFNNNGRTMWIPFINYNSLKCIVYSSLGNIADVFPKFKSNWLKYYQERHTYECAATPGQCLNSVFLTAGSNCCLSFSRCIIKATWMRCCFS